MNLATFGLTHLFEEHLDFMPPQLKTRLKLQKLCKESAILEPYLQLLQKYNKRFLKEYSDEPVHLRTQFVKILLDKVAQSWRKVRQSRSYFFMPTVLPKNEQMNSILLL